MTGQTTTPQDRRRAEPIPVHVFRTRFCGVALVAAAGLISAGELTTPSGSTTDDTAAQVDAFLAHPTLTQVSALLFHFGYLLVLPGIVGLLGLTRVRAVRLGHIGAAFAFLGFASLTGNTLIDLVSLGAGRELGAGTAARALDTAASLPATGAFIVPAFIGSFLGLVVLMTAVGRAGELAWAWVAATVVGVALIIAAPVHFVTVTGFIALSAGLAGSGARLLRG
jgi:hypothetical protein